MEINKLRYAEFDKRKKLLLNNLRAVHVFRRDAFSKTISQSAYFFFLKNIEDILIIIFLSSHLSRIGTTSM